MRLWEKKVGGDLKKSMRLEKKYETWKKSMRLEEKLKIWEKVGNLVKTIKLP